MQPINMEKGKVATETQLNELRIKGFNVDKLTPSTKGYKHPDSIKYYVPCRCGKCGKFMEYRELDFINVLVDLSGCSECKT